LNITASGKVEVSHLFPFSLKSQQTYKKILLFLLYDGLIYKNKNGETILCVYINLDNYSNSVLAISYYR